MSVSHCVLLSEESRPPSEVWLVRTPDAYDSETLVKTETREREEGQCSHIFIRLLLWYLISVRIMWVEEEMEDMDTSDTPWCWHYLADCGRWHRVEVSCFEYFLDFTVKKEHGAGTLEYQ